MYKIKKLEWDSNHFNLKIGNVFLSIEEQANLKEKYDIIIAKINSNKVEEIDKLQNDGFVLKDVLIKFYIENIQNLNCYQKNLIRLAKEDDLVEIQKIARNAFKKSHFYKNERLSKEKIDELYEKWIVNKFQNGNNIYIYIENKIIKGFLLALENSEEAVIDLIAVNPEFKNQGIGKYLIFKFFQENNLKKSYVGTQITNKDAIRLYEKMGYKIFDFTYIFHKNDN